MDKLIELVEFVGTNGSVVLKKSVNNYTLIIVREHRTVLKATCSSIYDAIEIGLIYCKKS